MLYNALGGRETSNDVASQPHCETDCDQ